MIAFVRSSRVLVRSFANEVLLMSTAGGNVDQLEGTAAAVWDLLEEPRAIAEIAAILSQAYGVASQRVEADLLRLLEDLVRRGWVERDG